MKKTLTAMVLVSSAMSPLSNASNTKNEADLNDLQNLNLENQNESSNLLTREPQFVTIQKEQSFLIDEYGNNVTTLNIGDKLQVLKKYDNKPFLKVNYNGQALFIANEAITPINELSYSGRLLNMNCSGEVISLTNENINVFNTDSTVGNILFNLSRGTHVNIIEKTKNNWYKIDYYGNIGFINVDNIYVNTESKARSVSLEKSTTKTGTVYNLSRNDTLNVRKQANTQSTVLTKLSTGTKVTILDSSLSNWYKVSVNNVTGYASKSYIKLDTIPTPTPDTNIHTTKYTVVDSHINLRTSASWSGTVSEKALIGTVLDVIEINGDWAKIYKDGKIVYAPSQYLKKNASSTTQTTTYKVVNGDINLRKSASWSGKIYKTIKVETQLEVVEITGVWATIYYDGQTLYAPASYLQAVNSVPPIVEEQKPVFTETELFMEGIVYNLSSSTTLNVRELPSTDSTILTKLNVNDKVRIVATTSNGWYKVNINGTIGYCSKSYIKEYTPQTTKYTVIDSPINLRRTSSWDGEIVEKVLVGTELDVIEINGDWASVYRNKETLYAPAKYLSDGSTPPVVEEQKPTFTETAFSLDGIVSDLPSNGTLSVRNTPFADGDLVTVLKNGDRVNVIAITSNDWYKVNTNGVVGYVNKKYISEYKPEVNSKPETTKYTVVTMDINLRRDASWSSEIVERISVGQTLDVIEINGDWASVYRNNETLYAPAKYLNNDNIVTPPIEDNTPEPPKVEEDNKEENKEETTPNFTVSDMKMHGVVCNVASNDVLNVRETPFASGKLITTLKNNQRVTVLGLTSTNWYKIDTNGTIGYVNKNYIGEYIPQTYRYAVINSNLDLRVKPSLDAEVAEIITIGNYVDVVEINGEWATIYMNKDFFYAPAKYLNNVQVRYTEYPYTLNEFIQVQQSRVPSYSISKFEEYLNPAKCNRFEFLELDKYRDIDVNKLNSMLISKDAGVLKGQGQTIINVAKKYNLDPLYFIAQSLHETGYGKSTLAKGVTITQIANPDKPIKDANGNITGYEMIPLDKPATVYNLYGIGAYDNLPTMPNRALILGTTYAYNQGWTSVEKALDGAGDFLKSNYIHSTKYDQNTLYKIRYNPSKTYIWHQYATTPWYSRDIALFMNSYQNLYINPNFTYDKPLFINMSEYSLNESATLVSIANYTLRAKEDITLQ